MRSAPILRAAAKRLQEAVMDLMYLALTGVFFALSLAFVGLCERL